jgi:hypothetical protein
MKYVFYSILLLLCLVGITLFFIYNHEVKNKINKFKSKINNNLNNEFKLTKNEKYHLFNYLEQSFSNILLPSQVILYEKNGRFINEFFKFYSNNQIVEIYIEFIPIKDNLFITKYNIFNKYGTFEHKVLNNKVDDIPEIFMLSEDNDIINDIINSEDTDILTTESLINNIKFN